MNAFDLASKVLSFAVDGALTVAKRADRVSRLAIRAYNRVAEVSPIPLPKVGPSDNGFVPPAAYTYEAPPRAAKPPTQAAPTAPPSAEKKPEAPVKIALSSLEEKARAKAASSPAMTTKLEAPPEERAKTAEDRFSRDALEKQTKAELQEILDGAGVGYGKKFSKAELIDLIMKL